MFTTYDYDDNDNSDDDADNKAGTDIHTVINFLSFMFSLFVAQNTRNISKENKKVETRRYFRTYLTTV